MIIKIMSRRGNNAALNVIRYVVKEEQVPTLHIPSIDRPTATIPGWVRHTEKDEIYFNKAQYEYLLWKACKESNIQPGNHGYKTPSLSEQGILTRNIRSHSIAGAAKEFQYLSENRQHQSRNMVDLQHCVISFDEKDSKTMTDAIALDLANEFINRFGNNCLTVGRVHRDTTDNVHVHLIVSATTVSFKSARITREALATIKREVQAIQKERYPQLTSLPRHGLAKEMQRTPEKNKNAERSKQSIEKYLEKILPLVTSTKELQEKLASDGHTIYMRNGRQQGIVFNDVKYRFSRLPVNLSKLQERDQLLEKQEKELSAIKSLRERKQERSIDIKTDKETVPDNLTKEQQTTFNEIMYLRQSASERNQEFEMAMPVQDNSSPGTINENTAIEKETADTHEEEESIDAESIGPENENFEND